LCFLTTFLLAFLFFCVLSIAVSFFVFCTIHDVYRIWTKKNSQT
jgi:hypothetical protein